ncbi:hypothetical protein EDC04DRAFT_2906918 [Pisolithus marmoratus]|nr:hypothetical protein EDC04DRAFT_2906918 [Pisolithus marmoratus]
MSTSNSNWFIVHGKDVDEVLQRNIAHHIKEKHLGVKEQQLVNEDSDAACKWKDGVINLRRDTRALQQTINKDMDIVHVCWAHKKWCNDLERVGATAGKLGVQFTLEQGSWFWQDTFNICILRAVKDIPIPRMECVDPEVDFVLENLNISSFKESTHTAWEIPTHIRMQALQLAPKEVSFGYKDKLITMGPTEFTGIPAFDFSMQGARKGPAVLVEHVDVHVAENFTFEVKNSDHPIIATVFKSVLLSRFWEAVGWTLEEYITGVVGLVDGIALNTLNRVEVFGPTGLGHGWGSYGSGHLERDRNYQGGLTGDAHMGAEPQILPGEKIPLGTYTEPLGERPELQGVVEGGVTVTESIEDVTREGAKEVQLFVETVRRKALEEKRESG